MLTEEYKQYFLRNLTPQIMAKARHSFLKVSSSVLVFFSFMEL